ncbi:FimV/HubP family polar landmark protein [Marinobacter sp.]|uniref:FimV/HubP family polar landmark protein n=1 Tax=Marinobacter sp. TaxID=50741 RepID=UPI003565059B
MKVRKLAVALALAGGLGSGMAQALGLGEIEMQSWLNQPLDAEITLRQSRGVDPGDVFVNVAPEAAYQRVGLERHHFLSKLKFEVVTEADGNLVINVSSSEAFREPYLNFLLELTWPNGRLMREYAVLVDPPVYAEESGIQQQVSVPSSSTRQRTSAAETTRSAESVRRQAAVEGSRSGGYSAESYGPTGPSDTLWTIAQRMRPDNSVSMQQVMLAIQDQNPDAFIGGNINRLKRGQVLRAPTIEQIQRRSRAEASRVVASQNEALKTPRPVDATRSAESTAKQTDQLQSASAGDELRLIAAEDAEAKSAEQGGSAGGDGDTPGGVDAGAAVALEELEAARRENEELNSRLEDMQSQVETLQRLLELKSSQLADMQGLTADDVGPEGAVPAESMAQAQEDPGVEGELGQELASQAGESVMDESVASGAEAEEPAEGALVDVAGEDGAMMAGDVAEGSEASVGVESGDHSGDDVALAAGPDQAAQDDPAAADAGVPAGSSTDGAAKVEDVEERKPQQPAAGPEKGLLGQAMDAIVNNPIYQMALGGGLLILLLLLLLVARRNANREKAFYDQLNADDDNTEDNFDLALDEEPEQKSAVGEDVLAEAETYIAYGRHDQAAQVLETAISREPSRVDLRLKLLETYADNQDRESFEKQYGEIEALGDEAAIQKAGLLKAQLEEAESMPSIDDLENQLRSDSFSGFTAASSDSVGEEHVSDEPQEEEFEASKGDVKENEFGELESDVAEETDLSDDLIEYDLSDIAKTDDVVTEETAEGSFEENDFSSFEMDLESESDAGNPDDVLGEDEFTLDFELDEPGDNTSEADASEDDLELDLGESLDLEEAAKPETDPDSEAMQSIEADLEQSVETAEENPDLESEAEPELGLEGLDESFLDELDAELEKVDEDSDTAELDLSESNLDDLELDVSDEDLALMGEFSDSEKSSGSEELDAPLEEALGLEDALNELEQDGSLVDEGAGVPLLDEEPSSAPSEDAGLSSALDIDDADLGDDDDFDFLDGTDEAATKLDLARAYIEMGDGDGARDILEEVALEGDDSQKAEAQELLKNLS